MLVAVIYKRIVFLYPMLLRCEDSWAVSEQSTVHIQWHIENTVAEVTFLFIKTALSRNMMT